MTYPIEFRKKVLEVQHKEKLTTNETARRFCIGKATVTRWVKRLETKTYVIKKRKLDLQKLAEDVKEYPDSYQYERAKRLGVGQNSIHHGLKKLKITYKKKFQTSQSRRRKANSFSRKNKDL